MDDLKMRRRPSLAATKPRKLTKKSLKPEERKYKVYDQKEINRALDEYHATTTSLKEIAKKYNIGKSVLARHKDYFMKEHGGQRVLTESQENQIIEFMNGFCSEWGSHLKHDDLRIFIKAYLDKLGIDVPRFKNNMPGKTFVMTFLRRHEGKYCYFPDKGKRPKTRGDLTPEVADLYFSTINCEASDKNVLDKDLFEMERNGTVEEQDEDSNSSVKFSSEIWGQFELEGSTAHCTICQKTTENTIEDMKSHLEEEHPGVLISILNNKSTNDTDPIEEEILEEDNEEDTFTEVVYLEEENKQKAPLKRPKFSKNVEKKQETPKIEYKVMQPVQAPAPSAKVSDRPEIDTFLSYVGVLLRNVPKESLPKLQLDVISLILNAQIATGSSVASKGPVCAAMTSTENYKIIIENSDLPGAT